MRKKRRTRELLFLATLAVSWWFSGADLAQTALLPLVVFSALAMRSQGVIVRNLSIEGITTTYITGMITALSAGLIDWLQLKLPGQNFGRRNRPPQVYPQKPGLLAAARMIYAVGAVAGGVIVMRWHSVPLLLPIFTIVLVIILVNSFHRRVLLEQGAGNLNK